MAEVKIYRVDLPDGRFVNVQSDKELTDDQIRQVQEMAPAVKSERGVLEGLLTGAATGVAPSAAFLKTLGTVGRATAGAGPMVSIPSSLLAGIAAAAATGIGQRKAIEAISPETARGIEESAAQQPIATMLGGALTSGFRPGASLAETALGKIAERAVPAALGGGIQLGTELMEGEGGKLPEGAAGRIATAAGINALLNRETALARRIIGPIRPPELPKVKPATPVTDNLGQVKAGEPLPSATAKANQMATGGAATGLSPTEQLKQQTAAAEAANRESRKIQEQVLGGFGSEAEIGPSASILGQEVPVRPVGARPSTAEEAASLLMGGAGKPAEESAAAIQQAAGMKSLEDSYIEAFDLIAELQQLTGRSRESIMNSIPDKEIDPMLAFLRSEVAYRKNPMVADVDRRIRELEIQAIAKKRRDTLQRAETMASREMEEATARAFAPEVRTPSALEAPETAIGELTGFRERPAMVTPERNVEVQIIEQTRRNRELRALEEKANRIQADLLQRGVDILPEQARELARMEPAEFNATRQRIIDAVVPEVQGPPVRRPTRLTALEALTPEAVGIEAPAPAPVAAPAPTPAPAAPRAARRAPRAMAEAPTPVPEVVLTERAAAPEAPAPAVSTVPEVIQKQLDQIKFTARRLTGEHRGKLTKKILIDPTGKVYNVDDSVGHPAYIKEFLPEYVKDGKPDVARMVKDGWYWGSVSKDNVGGYQFIDGATPGWSPTKPVPSALRTTPAETPVPAVSRAP